MVAGSGSAGAGGDKAASRGLQADGLADPVCALAQHHALSLH